MVVAGAHVEVEAQLLVHLSRDATSLGPVTRQVMPQSAHGAFPVSDWLDDLLDRA